jgi:hypothetical protein
MDLLNPDKAQRTVTHSPMKYICTINSIISNIQRGHSDSLIYISDFETPGHCSCRPTRARNPIRGSGHSMHLSDGRKKRKEERRLRRRRPALA